MKLDIIGDIHGCFDEFHMLTLTLGYNWDDGIPVHPDGRGLAFVGDLTDRGPDSVRVMDVVCRLFEEQNALYVPGNHCNKLYRYFLGNNVQETHGLETTVAELDSMPANEYRLLRKRFLSMYEESPLYQVLDDRRLVIAHAGIRADYIGRFDARVKTFVLYGDITGEKNADGSPVRRDWAKRYAGDAYVVYGHTPVSTPRVVGNTINIDTGCIFGGRLTALRWPERETVSVDSQQPLVEEKFRSFSDVS
ncbi:bis(5'-nucleosyl)-tetraphosphatase PrpE [Domibacillus robiginosus]|uniref:bis(5'-nucleosyl)-tetraphosphatase PrpE n=1 Tax=Domibacillus robiginosus TaxID=1071054 RepID=UPI00067C6017|nr:bis(5'-nucleosyl)-tetraphosphatase PrpE [Domibacillus robiginosus]